eukprot:g13790.t1
MPCPAGYNGTVTFACNDDDLTLVRGKCGKRCAPGTVEYRLDEKDPFSRALDYPDMDDGEELPTDCPGSLVGTVQLKCQDGAVLLREDQCRAARYAKEGSGVYLGLCATLLCRCAVGQVLTVPEARDTREAVRAGGFDSVCGDRLKAVGTFREMVFFQEEAVYPEFIVIYTRISCRWSGPPTAYEEHMSHQCAVENFLKLESSEQGADAIISNDNSTSQYEAEPEPEDSVSAEPKVAQADGTVTVNKDECEVRVALYPYTPTDGDEAQIKIEKNDLIKVFQVTETGWAAGVRICPWDGKGLRRGPGAFMLKGAHAPFLDVENGLHHAPLPEFGFRQQLERGLRGRLPFAVDALHGDRSQRDREAALQRFRSGATQVLLATDVAGRGIDVKETQRDIMWSGQWWVFTDDSVLVGATTKWNWHSVDLCAKDNEQDSMSLIAKVIKDSGGRMPPELAKRLLPAPAPFVDPEGARVDPRMHWLEPWQGLEGNKQLGEDGHGRMGTLFPVWVGVRLAEVCRISQSGVDAVLRHLRARDS